MRSGDTMQAKKVIISGAAGFIGAATAKVLLRRKFRVVGVDDLNPSYDPSLKKQRLKMLEGDFQFRQAAIEDPTTLKWLRDRHGDADCFLHMAALAGVRESFDRPGAYTKANIDGFVAALEFCRQADAGLIYASSSSVYGEGKRGATEPLSYYGATKLADEIIAATWCRRYGIEASGLRFASVYGPWGRPDTAVSIFAEAVLKGKTVDLFARGKIRRDFVYIDDITDGIVKLMAKPRRRKNLHKVYDMGFGRSVSVTEFLRIIEKSLGKKAKVSLAPANPGEPMSSIAPSRPARQEFGFNPIHSCRDGLPKAVAWHQKFYRS